MTKEETKELIAVMQAYVDGKKIEIFDESADEWIDIEYPVWNWYNNVYRIKPESSYRPFRNVEECWKEMQKHRPFGIMSSKNSKDYMSFMSLTTKAATSAATKAKASSPHSMTSNSPTAHPSESKRNNKINIC